MINKIDYEKMNKDLDVFFNPDSGAMKVAAFRDSPAAARMIQDLLGIIYALEENIAIYKEAIKDAKLRKVILSETK